MATTSHKNNPARTRMLNFLYDDLVLNSYYVIYSKYTQWDNDTAPPDVDASVQTSRHSMMREAYYGKRVQQDDAAFLIDLNTWTSNTVYDQYDDTDEDIEDLAFFVTTDERKTYKCLFNANGAPSTAKPTATSNTPFTSGDEYVWKYMFTASAANIAKHQTSDYTPILSNTTIEDAAVDGAIEQMFIITSGNNWTATDSGTILGVVSNTIYRISNNSTVVNNIFTDSTLHITTGNAAGLVSVIVSSFINSTGTYVTINGGNSMVEVGQLYTISPTISIMGDGEGAVAVAEMNTSAATIKSIAIVNTGTNYTKAFVEVTANTGYVNTEVELRAVISPPGGHGSSPTNELYSDRLSLAVETSNTDSIPTTVDFRRVGLLVSPYAYGTNTVYTDPEFRGYWSADIALLVGSTDPFTADETIIGTSANATVLWSNTTKLYYVDIAGEFANGEVLVGGVSGTLATVSNIAPPDIDMRSGCLMYTVNTDRVLRTNTSTEVTKFIITA